MAYEWNNKQKNATTATKAYHDTLLAKMDEKYLQAERHDLELLKKHLIYPYKSPQIRHVKGSPDTVNPYLWQTIKDNEIAGVVQLAENYYIVTGVDVAMIGFIHTEHGWIIQDCGNYEESAKEVLALVEEALQEDIKNNIKAIVISHSHVDHYGGIKAFINETQIGLPEDGKIPVIAPSHYEQSLIDDNLYAGVAMSRRLQYQGGFLLEHNEKGSVGCGLNSVSVMGKKNSVVMPNVLIEKDKTLEIDGVKIDFILSPNTETRAHMCTYYQKDQVLFLGDNAMGTLHNTYTMRGARVRDANFWGTLFYRLYVKYGDQLQAVYQGHGLAHVLDEDNPQNLKEFLLDNAVAYKYTNDQALLLANKGYSLNDIGHMNIPEEISKRWYTRPHYGHYSMNARGAYMRYLGFYDGNPVNLLPLQKQEEARKLVEYIGSEELILEKAVQDFKKGEYQWVATITNYLVYLNPDNEKARYLCADALEQLGYQAESGLWRNAYLSGALELRKPRDEKKKSVSYMNNQRVMPYVSSDLLLDYLGINFDGEKGISLNSRFVLAIQSQKENTNRDYQRVEIYKGTILHTTIEKEDILPEDTVISIDKGELYELASGQYKNLNDAKAQSVLESLAKYVVDTSKYQNFALIEPLEKEQGDTLYGKSNIYRNSRTHDF